MYTHVVFAISWYVLLMYRYVGCIGSNEAEKMLKEAQFDGTYLVREKKECKKTYEICVK